MTFDNRYDVRNEIERARVLSDNYNAYIIQIKDNKENIVLNLGDYGLKEVKWEARDELIVKKPCTRREEIAHVHIKGFDLDFHFAKNSSDIMKMLLDQHIAYYGGMNLNRSALEDTKNRVNKLMIQERTAQKELGDITLSKVGADKKITSSPATSFSIAENDLSPTYVVPYFDVRINIQHHSKSVESYQFKQVSFYKPSQSTSENGSEIIESIRAFAVTVELVGQHVSSPNAEKIIHEQLSIMLATKVDTNKLQYHDRKIINQDNLNLYKNSGKFSFT